MQPLWALAGPIVRPAGIVTGEMEPGRLLSEVRSLGVFSGGPRENVKPGLGYVFVRFLRDQEFLQKCETLA